MIVEQDVRVNVCYGLGASLIGRFARHAVEGLRARELVQKVIDNPQPTESAVRTARVLGKALSSGRPIDVELSDGTDSETNPGRPIVLDDVVVPSDEGGPHPDQVTVLISEAYRGG